MKIAITGGTGFVGGHLADQLVSMGHRVVLVGRGVDRRGPGNRLGSGQRFAAADVADPDSLARVFEGCDAVAHCAGINREIGPQTYERAHVEGTRNVVRAAHLGSLRKIVLVSFLRARPGCGSPYHESKWAAEEIVRGSGLDYTIFKPGVIYGLGDHMLDHLSRAIYTFPVFFLVGLRDRRVRPLAVEDLARLMAASLVEDRMSCETIAVTGPEEIDLGEAVRRVARVVGRRPLVLPAPVALHRAAARLFELGMRIPLASLAQVRILAEGLVEPAGSTCGPPEDLRPRTRFTEAQIRKGLPPPGGFSLGDCRWFARRGGAAGAGR